MDIRLNFINQSNDQNNSEVVICAKPGRSGLGFINDSNDKNNSEIVIFQETAPAGDTVVAWLVIQNCGRGDNHPFAYSSDIAVGASDSYGNFTPRFPAEPGQVWELVRKTSGDQLQLSSQTAPPGAYGVSNALASGAVGARIYRNDKLYTVWDGIQPHQTAVFEFKPTIFIGAVSQVEEGQVLNAALLSQISTEISLIGIASADIVMTGGGSGPDAKPFVFTLQNVAAA